VDASRRRHRHRHRHRRRSIHSDLGRLPKQVGGLPAFLGGLPTFLGPPIGWAQVGHLPKPRWAQIFRAQWVLAVWAVCPNQVGRLPKPSGQTAHIEFYVNST
jgi:hypothetical protein